MPLSRNGSGVYSLPAGSTVANGDVSDATDVNTPLADIAADLNIARPIVAGGTGATTASGARSALGLAIGTDIQAYDADLTAIAALSSAADKVPYATGSGTWALADLTSAGRALIDDASASAQLTTLGVSAFAKTVLDDADASAFLTTLGVSTFIKTLLDDTDDATARTTLGAHPLAINGSGVGQFTTLLVGPSTALSLPAGGTWLYYFIRESATSGVFQAHATNIAAGGTQIASSTAGVNTYGFAWRIA